MPITCTRDGQEQNTNHTPLHTNVQETPKTSAERMEGSTVISSEIGMDPNGTNPRWLFLLLLV